MWMGLFMSGVHVMWMGAVHVLSSCYLDGGCSWSHELRLYLLEFLSFCMDEFYLLEINHGHC